MITQISQSVAIILSTYLIPLLFCESIAINSYKST